MQKQKPEHAAVLSFKGIFWHQPPDIIAAVDGKSISGVIIHIIKSISSGFVLDFDNNLLMALDDM